MPVPTARVKSPSGTKTVEWKSCNPQTNGWFRHNTRAILLFRHRLQQRLWQRISQRLRQRINRRCLTLLSRLHKASLAISVVSTSYYGGLMKEQGAD
jgi:hypothetical protein